MFCFAGALSYAQSAPLAGQPSARPTGLMIDNMTFGGLDRFKSPKVSTLAFFNAIDQLNPGWIVGRNPIQNRAVIKQGFLVLPDPDQAGSAMVKFAWYRCDEKPKNRGLTPQLVDDFERERQKHLGDGAAHGFFVVKIHSASGDDAVWQVRTPGSLTVRSAIQFTSNSSDPFGVSRSAVYQAIAAAGTPPYVDKQIK